MSLRPTLHAFQALGRKEQVFALAATAGSLWLLAKLLRAILSAAFPDKLPGEPNTALLASPRANTTSHPTAADLSSASDYDYIIIGTGTAGSVLASRLTEDPSVRVLAIESGHSDLKQLFSRIPAAFAQLFSGAADWALSTEVQKDAGGRKLFWPRGRMLGGCSSINAMVYNTGAPDDYDEWARLGNEGWSYEDVNPYRKKAECLKEHEARKLSAEELAEHGLSGPWQVGYTTVTGLSEKFVDACTKVGFTKKRDINSKQGTNGVSVLQTFIDSAGQRSSAAVAYLTTSVCSRPNLKIATGQNVTRIIFDNSSPPRAVGVEMSASSHSPVRYLAKANTEILLCAGAVHTPHLLKLSGIGPAAELARHGISLVKELPAVGANLADHLFGTLVAKVTKGTSLQYLADPIASLPALITWLRTGKGAMSSNVAEAAGYCRVATRDDCPAHLKAKDLTSGPSSSDIEILEGPLVYIDHGRVQPSDKGDYFSIGPILLRPESRGTIELKSADPFDQPLIHANYLSSQHDVDMLVYGLKICMKIMHSQPMAEEFKGWYWPNEQIDSMDDAALEAHVRKTCETIYHPMCTARMGRGEADSVVDSQLRVHGVQGLRIADASVFPTPIACHPCAPVIMVGEKAADMIKAGRKA